MPGTVTSANVTSANRLYLHLAPVGTPAPADATVAMPAAWKSVGYTVPDSFTFTTEPEFEDINSHQSDYRVRSLQTSDSATLNVDLLEWSTANFQAVFGGGTTTPITGTPTQYRYAPPRLGARAEVAACVEIIDGSKNYRLIAPRTQQTEGVEMALQKGSAAALSLALSILGGDAGDSWYILSNDPSMAPAA